MKLLFKLISMFAVFVLLLSGSKCAEKNGDDEKDIQIQNEMKASEMQDNGIENTDNSHDDYDDDAQNAGEDLLELDDMEIRGPMSKEESNNPSSYFRRRYTPSRSRKPEKTRRRRRWDWKK